MTRARKKAGNALRLILRCALLLALCRGGSVGAEESAAARYNALRVEIRVLAGDGGKKIAEAGLLCEQLRAAPQNASALPLVEKMEALFAAMQSDATRGLGKTQAAREAVDAEIRQMSERIDVVETRLKALVAERKRQFALDRQRAGSHRGGGAIGYQEILNRDLAFAETERRFTDQAAALDAHLRELKGQGASLTTASATLQILANSLVITRQTIVNIQGDLKKMTTTSDDGLQAYLNTIETEIPNIREGYAALQ